MTTTADEPPYFPATAPAELADAGTAVSYLTPWTPPEQACEAALEFFRGMVVPEYRGEEGRLLRRGGPRGARRAGADAAAGLRREASELAGKLTDMKYPIVG
jgi:hypothetical protein